MNWEAISAIAETTGVIVVILSLIYLATQIKFAKLAAADVSRHLRSNGVREIGFTIATNSDLRKNWVESGGVGAETSKILKNLLQALPDFGLTLADLVSAKIHTTQFDQFPEINKAWEGVFTDDMRPPARSAVGVTALPLNANVEMSFVFYKD